MHILVTAPIPSHPQNHGNRARVFAVCKALQDAGARIHYVYGGLEGLTEHQELAMRETWDHVHVLPAPPSDQSPQNQKPRGKKGFAIDDWYRAEMDIITQQIMSIWRIECCIANYAWFSRWLEQVPGAVPRYIDTHDVFADRHTRLKSDGIKPSWFSTSPKEEAKALSRASKIIAIQDSEASHFRNISKTPVVTLGHFIDPEFLPSFQPKAGKKITIGYIASDNPINQASLLAFDLALADRPHLKDRYEFKLAGAICGSPAAATTQFETLGFVESARRFYSDCDLIINPNVGGTGLKIKSIEALAYGKALIATGDAMTGIETSHPLHHCKDAAALCKALDTLTPDLDIPPLEQAAKDAVASYTAIQRAALLDLFPSLFRDASAEMQTS